MTPDGITTAAEGEYVSGSPYVLSLYNIDGLGPASGITRSVSAWVRVNADGYRVRENSWFAQQALPADTWVRVQTSTPVDGSSQLGMHVQRISGTPSPEDRGWITGIMSVEGIQHHSFADGNSPNWIWNGTSLASSSIGPAP